MTAWGRWDEDVTREKLVLETIRMSAGANCIMRRGSHLLSLMRLSLSWCQRAPSVSIAWGHGGNTLVPNCPSWSVSWHLTQRLTTIPRYIYKRISKYLFNFKDRDEFWHFLCFETILLFCQYWQHKYCGWKQQLFEQIFTEVKEVLLIL